MDRGKVRPPESSKERVQRCRDKKTDDEKKKSNEKSKIGMQKRRSEMTTEAKDLQREKNRKRMAKRREEKRERLESEKVEKRIREVEALDDKARSQNNEYMRRRRKNMSGAEKEYDRIMQLLRNRKQRGDRNGKNHLLDNLEAKQGMRWFREDGRVLKFKERLYYKKNEMEIWKMYWDLGEDFKKVLKERNEEVFKKLEEEERKKKEEELIRKNEEEEEAPKEGEWVFRGGDYFWEGEGDPPEEADPNMDTNQFEWTEEDERRFKEQKEEEIEMSLETMRRMMKEDKEERKKEEDRKRIQKNKDLAEYMKNYREKKRAALMKPIEKPKVSEKSEYLLLQEKNIAELEERKKASGLFDD